MLVQLEHLGVFSLMKTCVAKWLKANLKIRGDGFKIFTALAWYMLSFMASLSFYVCKNSDSNTCFIGLLGRIIAY